MFLQDLKAPIDMTNPSNTVCTLYTKSVFYFLLSPDNWFWLLYLILFISCGRTTVVPLNFFGRKKGNSDCIDRRYWSTPKILSNHQNSTEHLWQPDYVQLQIHGQQITSLVPGQQIKSFVFSPLTAIFILIMKR